MTTETNAERLRIIKTESELTELAGIEYRVIRLQDFNWIIQQAERAQELEEEIDNLRWDAAMLSVDVQHLKNENACLREAIKQSLDAHKWNNEESARILEKALKGEEK